MRPIPGGLPGLRSRRRAPAIGGGSPAGHRPRAAAKVEEASWPSNSRRGSSESRPSTQAPDYFRHDGVQQNLFTGNNFIKGRQSFMAGGGPSLSIGLTDAIFAPLAARQLVAARRADLQAARNDALRTVSQAFFNVQESRGRLLGVGAAIARAELLVRFATALALSLDRAAGDQPGADRASEPPADPAGRHPRLADRQRSARRDPPARPRRPARAGGAAVPPGHAHLGRLDARPTDTPIALRNRPELASRRGLLAVARAPAPGRRTARSCPT